MTHDARRSPFELISDAFNEVSALFSTEARLLRAELRTKIDHVIAAIGMMLGAAVFFIGAIVLLLQTGVALLVQWGFSTLVASIIMAVASGVIGIVLFIAGKSALSPDHLKPQRAMNQIILDVAMARDVASNRQEGITK